jgi:hypothetical protein
LITDNASWQWCSFVNVPVGITAAALTFFFLRNPEEPRITPVDGVGVALLASKALPAGAPTRPRAPADAARIHAP